MAAYVQPTPKRQKMRDQRAADFVDYFQGVDRIEYKQVGGANDVLCYRHYNGAERLHGRTMEEWLKLSVSFSAFKFGGSALDAHGKLLTYHRNWQDGTNSMENRKHCIKACFDFCQKLGIKYWTAFDSDLVVWSDNFEEYKTNWDEMADFVVDLSQRTNIKPLWIAPDLHSHSRYALGAMTSNEASVFAHTGAQTKKCLEMAQRMNAECFLFWPHKETYDTPFKSDIQREMKLLAKLFKMAADYKERINYRGQMIICPYYENIERKDYTLRENFKQNFINNRYMWDAISCLYFLRHHNLERYYKVCAPPGHQLYLTYMYNSLGGVRISGGEILKDLVITMKALIDQGCSVIGGVNLNVVPWHETIDKQDLVAAFVRRADTVARALRIASSIIAEQVFSKYVQQKYSSYGGGWGARVATDLILDECEEHFKKNQNQHNEASSKSEYWDLVFQRYFDVCNHI